MLTENILFNVLSNKEFFDRVYPHLKEEYFNEAVDRVIFSKIKDFESRYLKIPSINDLHLMVETDTNINEVVSNSIYTKLDEMKNIDLVSDVDFLVNETEKWAQDRALEGAILASVELMQKGGKNKGIIEDYVRDALAVQFDVSIGHDYFKDAEARFNHYNTAEDIIPFERCKTFNDMLCGGLRKKTLIVFTGGPNKGKSLFLCHTAAELLAMGKNVLYVSGEMSEMGLSQRIDSNLLEIKMDDLSPGLDKKLFMSKLKNLYKKSQGRLFIKEFSAGTASANHVRTLINEARRKMGVIIDAVVVDYLDLFLSTRLPAAAMSNTYLYLKALAEEFRGIAREYNIPVISAGQMNRTAANKSAAETDMDGTANSYGLPFTVDAQIAIIQNDELREQKKYLLKVLKTRFGKNNSEVYTVMSEIDYMRLVDPSDQERELPIHIKDKLRLQAEELRRKENESAFDFSN